MTEACDGREVVGMDMHRRRSVLVRGQKIETARITNSPAELRRQIAPAETHTEVGAGRQGMGGTGRRSRWLRLARRFTWRTRWA
jgi:hypothetical protein